jgi:hypothetical protein
MTVRCLICKEQGRTTEISCPIISDKKNLVMPELGKVIGSHMVNCHPQEHAKLETSMFVWMTFNALNQFEDIAVNDGEDINKSMFETEKENLRDGLLPQLLMNAPDYDDDEEDEDEEDEEFFDEDEEDEDEEDCEEDEEDDNDEGGEVVEISKASKA